MLHKVDRSGQLAVKVDGGVYVLDINSGHNWGHPVGCLPLIDVHTFIYKFTAELFFIY